MAQTRGTLLSLASMQIAGSGRVSADAVDRALGRVLNDAREAVLGSQTLEEDVRRRWARYRRAAVEDATGEAGRNECSGEEVIELGPDDPCPF
jgi:hypothetical protein